MPTITVRISEELERKIALDMKRLGISDRTSYIKLMLLDELPGISEMRKEIQSLKYTVVDMSRAVEGAAENAVDRAAKAVDSDFPSLEGAVGSLEIEIDELKEKIDKMFASIGELSVRLKDIEDKMLRIEIAMGTIPQRKK